MKKYFKFGLLAVVFSLLGFLGVKVFAESASPDSNSSSSADISPMIINIGPSGNVLLRGVIDGAPGSGSLKVKSWGVSWNVNVPATARIMSATKSISDLADGDFVGILGTVSSDGNFVIDAKIVREWRNKSEQQKVDWDQDGIPDRQDADDDDDGVPDTSDIKSHDHDNDGIDDKQDADDDNDGIEDSKDLENEDHDNDGIHDSQDKHDDSNDNNENDR